MYKFLRLLQLILDIASQKYTNFGTLASEYVVCFTTNYLLPYSVALLKRAQQFPLCTYNFTNSTIKKGNLRRARSKIICKIVLKNMLMKASQQHDLTLQI